MQVTEQITPLPTQPISDRPVQGDPAARRVGIFLFCALALLTIGAAIGIGVGNIAHYRYFPPTNQSLSNLIFPNGTTLNIARRSIVPKIRAIWLSINESQK